MCSNYQPISILPIISKVFQKLMHKTDTVDHYILIRKLEHYGVRGIELEWCKSYLSDRKQAMKIGLNQSSFQAVQ